MVGTRCLPTPIQFQSQGAFTRLLFLPSKIFQATGNGSENSGGKSYTQQIACDNTT